MNCRLVVALATLAFLIPPLTGTLIARQTPDRRVARERRIPAGKTTLYAREIGAGRPLILLHGGPDFDHRYLLPDMDRFADMFRLIYYDQRGRGMSAEGVRAEDVSMSSDIDDVDVVRRQFNLDSAAILGHSWGAVLALEYALRYPTRVSQLVLMNPAPVSAADVAVLLKVYMAKLGDDMDRQRAIVATPAYKQGDPETVAARYRIHFKAALARPADYEKLMTAMKAAFISQGKDGIVKARAVEDRLRADTWNVSGYDLLPKLKALTVPTLVITGDHDFIPIEIAGHIARAVPGSRLVTIKNCGHFAYLECAADVRREFDGFFDAAAQRRGGVR